MSIGKKSIVGVFWSVVEGIGSKIGSFIIFFILSRLLSPEAFGLVAMAGVFLAFMNIFLNQGFAQALIQRQELEPEHLDTAFWTNVAIGVSLASLGILSAGIVSGWFNQPQLAPIFRCFCLLFVITSFSNVQKALLEREFDFKAIARRSILGIFCGGIVGIGMALSGYGVWSLIGKELINELVSALVLWHASDWRPRFLFSKSHFNQLFSFGSSLLLLSFVSFFNKKSTDLLIGVFLGVEALGYYAVAKRLIMSVLELMVKTTSQVSLPMFSRLRQDMDQFRKAFYTATQLSSILAFPVFSGLFLLAPEVIILLSGEKWVPSVPIVRVMTFLGFIQSISFFKGSVIVSMGKPWWRLWDTLIVNILNLIGFAIVYPWGIVGVTIATTISRYLVFPIGQWMIYRLAKISLRRYFSQFLLPSISSIAMAASMLFTKWLLNMFTSSYLVTLSACSLIGIVVYVIIIYFNLPDSLSKLKAKSLTKLRRADS